MQLEQQTPLWNKIQDFTIEDATFSGKLSASQNWSPSFTQRAIEEYKKFIFLCCISPTGAAPSHTVDEVWHLHLTYTHSYWTNFCKKTLDREIHHHPSKGGKEEDEKHQKWYKETLHLYKEVFGTDPPADIWPAPRLTIVELVLKWNWVSIASILLFPFLFILVVYQKLSPFSLKGLQFLVFFPLYGAAIILSYIIYHKHNEEKIKQMTADNFPEDASPFQMAEFLHGKHRAIQTGIIDLLKRDLLAVGNNKRFVIKNKLHKVMQEETNPLMPALIKEEHGNPISYDDIVKNWYTKESFSHPALDVLYEFAHRKKSFFHRYYLHISVYTVAVARIIQGIANGKPSSYLFVEAVLLTIVFYFVKLTVSVQAVMFRKSMELFSKQIKEIDNKTAQIAPLYALQGTSAIYGFAESALLIGMFGAYTGSNQSSDWSGGSSCSSSCGSSCGGGGCGGCGGGD